jgi:hypothetical protein
MWSKANELEVDVQSLADPKRHEVVEIKRWISNRKEIALTIKRQDLFRNKAKV